MTSKGFLARVFGKTEDDSGECVHDRVLGAMHLHAVLPRLQELVRMDDEARGLVKGLDMRLEFKVFRGPRIVLAFKDGQVTASRDGASNVGLLFPSHAALNRMFAGENVVPIPFKGFWHLGKMKAFTRLTEILTEYLKPGEGALDDPAFRLKHVELSLLVGLAATDAVLALDPRAARIAAGLHEGTILYRVGDQLEAHVIVRKSGIEAHGGSLPEPTTTLQIRDVDLCVDLIAGKVDTFAAMGACDVMITGGISLADEFNTLFDRVGLFLS